jgi:formamidopyrimidine-DNA glycosylase
MQTVNTLGSGVGEGVTVGTGVGIKGGGLAQHVAHSAKIIERMNAALSFKGVVHSRYKGGCILLSSTALVKLERRAYNCRTMPELPEVETVARGLCAALTGHTITGAKVLWARSVASSEPDAFTRRIAGQTVIDVGRRGKWIVMALSNGDALLVHLRMSGRLLIESGDCLDDRHLRVMFLLDDGRRLSFVDQRKFGRLHLTDEPEQVLGDLGPEPLSDAFTAQRFEKMLELRHGRIKPLLLNQRFLAGLGNIYTDESLWRAQIHPLRAANTLTHTEVQRLHQAIRKVLAAAINSGGTTLDDQGYRRANGRMGEFAGKLAVYGRADQPCPRCGQTIARIRVSQRGTHFCPNCQPLQQKKFKVQGIDSETNKS